MAGFDLTTYSFNLPGGRRSRYHYTRRQDIPAHLFVKICLEKNAILGYFWKTAQIKQ
jgi:hypothetical protein